MIEPHIQAGNAVIDTKDTRGWLVGHFIEEQFGLRHTQDVEIKWSVFKAGEAREEWVTGETRTAICLLVSGVFEMDFRHRTVVFEKPGDYVMWGPGVDHRWRARTDCVWLTIRWPSIAVS